MTVVTHYLRIESAAPNRRGRHPGMFALLRGLRTSGRLSPDDVPLAAELVRRSYALHTEPPAEPFDTDPPAISWFIEQDSPAAHALTALAADVVSLLARYGIACREVRCTQVGEITHSDHVQVVAVPLTSADWRL